MGDAGPPGLAILIEEHHGVAALAAADLAAGKFMVDITVDPATTTADAAGVVTVNYAVKTKDGKPVTGVSAPTFNISKLVPPAAGSKDQFTHWESYIYRTATVINSATGNWPNPDGTKADQAYRENNKAGQPWGTLTDHGDGTYTYVFKTNISAITTPVAGTAITYERSRKHRIAVMMGGHVGATGSQTFDFVPDGTTTDTTSRDIIQTTACKSCHGDEFHGHGGDRLTVEVCATCHQPGSFDPHSGETLDLKVMIHKIHAGAELQSTPGADGVVWDNPATVVDETADNGPKGNGVPYSIWGANGGSGSNWYQVGFPAILENCTKCHNGTGKDVDNWKAVPSTQACGSCHDMIDFTKSPALGGHKGGAKDNSSCMGCHDGSIAPDPVTAHDWVNKDPRNLMEFTPTITVSAPANGQFFTTGEKPVVSVSLKDATTQAVYDWVANGKADDGATAFPPGDGPEGCVANAAGTDCLVDGTHPARDGKLSSSSLFVNGPRAERTPALTLKARVVIKGTNTPTLANGTTTYNLSSATFASNLNLIVDQGSDVYSSDGTTLYPGTFSVPVYASGGSDEVALGYAYNGSATGTFTAANQAIMGGNHTWIDHQYAGYTVTFTNNSQSGAPKFACTILDNVGATVTLAACPAWVTNAPAASDVLTFSSNGFAQSLQGISSGVGTTTTLLDAAQSWVTDQWKGYTVKIVNGTGIGQSGSVTGNSKTQLTIGTAWATAPDATSVYSIQPFANVAAATPAEVITWLNTNPSFKARAVAYLEESGSALGGSTAAALAVGGTSFTLKTANTGVAYPVTGNVIIDRFTSVEETLAFTRAGDVFTIAGAAKAHAAGASLQVHVANPLAIRSRKLGSVWAMQVNSSSTAGLVAQLFPNEGAAPLSAFPIHLMGSNTPGALNQTGTASTLSNTLAKPTDTFAQDPKVKYFADHVEYTLDPVDDLVAGTYTAKLELSDRGSRVTDVDYKTPTVARVNFQVGQATEEAAPADNCGSCHTDPTDTKGFVVDYNRHNKLLNNTAVDLCASCHDYQPASVTSGVTASGIGGMFGAVPISRRVHGVHNGSALKYPNLTVSHSDTEIGRNWFIEFPQDVRTCDATCHTDKDTALNKATSGTWKTKPARLPCGGCHDDDAATAHMNAMTYDPTPAYPFSGDERESCAMCHAP